MWLKDKINSLFNNLKTDTMAKQESNLFKQSPTNNHREVATEFTKLDAFIEAHEQINEVDKNKVKRLVEGYKERTGEKISHINNVALLTTAVTWTNNYIQSLTK